MTRFRNNIFINSLRIFIKIILILGSLLMFGHFIAHFSIRNIRLFKYIILTSSFFIIILSILLIYTDIVPIIIFVSILSSLRWAKYTFQNYPFIESVEALANFGISSFLTVCSVILWIIFEVSNLNSFSCLKFSEFFFSTILVPLMIIFTICFNKKTIKKDQPDSIIGDDTTSNNFELRNYYIEFSNRVYSKFIIEPKQKTKNN